MARILLRLYLGRRVFHHKVQQRNRNVKILKFEILYHNLSPAWKQNNPGTDRAISMISTMRTVVDEVFNRVVNQNLLYIHETTVLSNFLRMEDKDKEVHWPGRPGSAHSFLSFILLLFHRVYITLYISD